MSATTRFSWATTGGASVGTAAAPPSVGAEPLVQLEQQGDVALDAIALLHEGLRAVDVTAHHAHPDVARRVYGEVRLRGHALEALTSPVVDAQPVVARLVAAHPELDHGARVARRAAIEDHRHAHDDRLGRVRHRGREALHVERP